ncbi:MAG: beta strand repeat-containing protein, partial [Armatimonadota bacterium]
PMLGEVTVAGFRVTNFQGTMGADGSFCGSGDLQLPFGGSVRATFAVDKSGHVTSGSWSGSFSVRGRTFTSASGTLDDRGIHWNQATAIGPVGNVLVAFALQSDGSLSAAGSVNYSICGAQKQFVVAVDASGALTATYVGSVTLNSFSLTSARLTLSDSGAVGTGTYRLPDGTEIQLNVSVPPAGGVVASGSGTFRLAGFQVADATFSLGSNSMNGSGRINVPGGSSTVFTFRITPDGAVTGSASADLSIGGFTLAGSALTVDSTRLSGLGRISLPGGSQAVFALTLPASGPPSGSCTSDMTVCGWNLTQTSLTLDSAGVHGTARIALPGGSRASANITLSPSGQFGGSITGTVTANGWIFANTALTIANDTISGAGNILVPNGPSLGVTIRVTSGGQLSATGSGNVPLYGFEPTNINYSVGNDRITGSGALTLPGGSQSTLSFEIDRTGRITGSLTGTVNIAGWQIGSAALALSAAGLSGTGNLTLPGGTTCRASLVLTPAGQFSGSFRGDVAIRGWHIGAANLIINNSTITGSGSFTLPGGASTGVSLTAGSDGSFTATSTSGITIKGWNLANASFRITGDSATADGGIDLVGATAAFNFNIDKNGTFAGHSSSNLSIGVTQGKSISISSVSLDVQPSGTISGTGNVQLGNRTITSATISITPSGSMSAVGVVP